MDEPVAEKDAFEYYAEVGRALASSKRLHVLRCLREREKTVSEILACKSFEGVPQSTVSQHLALLRQTGLVKARREGTNIYYTLSNPKIMEIFQVMDEVVTGEFSRALRLAKLRGHAH